MAGMSIERCLTMSAYSGFLALCQYLRSHPTTSPEEAITTIQRINADAAYLDYTGGLMLHEHIGIEEFPEDHREFLRAVIRVIIQDMQPWWLRLTPYGREKVRASLEIDQVQCFREAGLFDPVPNEKIIAWWDEIASTIRGVANSERLARGRKAEKLSLEYERDRLKRIGVTHQPRWVSLEDNTLGYDIKSFDLVDGYVVNRLIEVKSSQTDAIYLTRNEWDNAVSAQSQHLFHIWRMPAEYLVELSVSEILVHIPIDQGNGSWQEVRIENIL